MCYSQKKDAPAPKRIASYTVCLITQAFARSVVKTGRAVFLLASFFPSAEKVAKYVVDNANGGKCHHKNLIQTHSKPPFSVIRHCAGRARRQSAPATGAVILYNIHVDFASGIQATCADSGCISAFCYMMYPNAVFLQHKNHKSLYHNDLRSPAQIFRVFVTIGNMGMLPMVTNTYYVWYHAHARSRNTVF